MLGRTEAMELGIALSMAGGAYLEHTPCLGGNVNEASDPSVKKYKSV